MKQQTDIVIRAENARLREENAALVSQLADLRAACESAGGILEWLAANPDSVRRQQAIEDARLTLAAAATGHGEVGA